MMEDVRLIGKTTEVTVVGLNVHRGLATDAVDMHKATMLLNKRMIKELALMKMSL